MAAAADWFQAIFSMHRSEGIEASGSLIAIFILVCKWCKCYKQRWSEKLCLYSGRGRTNIDLRRVSRIYTFEILTEKFAIRGHWLECKMILTKKIALDYVFVNHKLRNGADGFIQAKNKLFESIPHRVIYPKLLCTFLPSNLFLLFTFFFC